MADTLTSVMTLDENKIYRGASRLIYGRIGLAEPTKIEDVIDPSTYALASGYNDWGMTDEDGVSISRESELFDGIPLDQVSVSFLNRPSFARAMKWATSISFGHTKEQAFEVWQR